MRTRAHRHIRATLRVRLVCSLLRLCRLTYYLARRRLWLCSTCRVQLHGYMVAGRSHQVSPQVCQVRISVCNGKLHTCFVTSSCTFYTDRIKLPRCSAPALPLLCRCSAAAALPLLLRDAGGSSARAGAGTRQPAACSKILGRMATPRQRTSLSQLRSHRHMDLAACHAH